jgi:hypothetical protein
MPRTKAPPALYRFRLEFFHGKDRRVHELPLAKPDFARAVEAAFFEALRRGLFDDYTPPADALLLPCFAAPGSPRADGFAVALPLPGGDDYRKEFPSEFFDRRARRVAAELARAGRVEEGSTVLYQLSACLEDGEEKPARGLRITVEPESIDVPIRPGSRSAFGPAEPWDGPHPEDLPVLLPRRVIEEALDDARRDPGREVGGALLGHLRRDGDELYLEVTCQVPAEQTSATETSITFTPQTWARVREVIEVRGEGEIFVGWVHSHPFRLCKDCPLVPPPECVAKVLFFSADDEFLMELSFPRPFMVGLLTAVEPKLEAALGHAPVRLYGWRDGAIVPRGFHVIDD